MASWGFMTRPRLAVALIAFTAASEASEDAVAPDYAWALELDDACVPGGPSCSLSLSQLRASARGGHHSSSLAEPISPHVLEAADPDLALLASGVPAANIASLMARESLVSDFPGPDEVAPAVLHSELPWATDAAHEAEQKSTEVEAQQAPAQAEAHVESDAAPTDPMLAASTAPQTLQENATAVMPPAMQEDDSDDSGQKEERRLLEPDMFTKQELISMAGEDAGALLWDALDPENFKLDDEFKQEIIALADPHGAEDLKIYLSPRGDSEATLAHINHTHHSKVRSHSKAPQSRSKAHKAGSGAKRHAHSHVPSKTAANSTKEASYTTNVGGLEIVVMGEPDETKHRALSHANSSDFEPEALEQLSQ